MEAQQYIELVAKLHHHYHHFIVVIFCEHEILIYYLHQSKYDSSSSIYENKANIKVMSYDYTTHNTARLQ